MRRRKIVFHKPINGNLMLLILLSIVLSDCADGKRPFLNASICLDSQRSVIQFKKMIQLAAAVNGMKYFDRTDETEREYYILKLNRLDDFVLNAGALAEDGMAVTASEIQGPGYQIGLGFSEGSRPIKARIFANQFIKLLSIRWKVVVIPGNVGILPEQNCHNN
jgi:hypothetical protein